MDRHHIVLSVILFSNTAIAVQKYNVDYGFGEDKDIVDALKSLNMTINDKRYDDFLDSLEVLSDAIVNSVERLLLTTKNQDDVNTLKTIKKLCQTAITEVQLITIN